MSKRDTNKPLPTKPWDRSWKVVRRVARQGGQGSSFQVERRVGHEYGFLKTLQRQRDMRARKRFRREATAYETLDAPGVPRLREHNAAEWANRDVELYIVLEWIDGVDLGARVEASGPLERDEAIELVLAIADTLVAAHMEEFIHRDIKPGNVMLRHGDARSPVLVDFGLSFNQVDEVTDVTRVGEEVGNRFLRLPEHSSSIRSPVSDITQLAGILVYGLTGVEPRGLVDETGRLPHQRERVAGRLSDMFNGRERLRLLSLLDRCFTSNIEKRVQTADEFRQLLNDVLRPADHESLAGLRAQVGEITAATSVKEGLANDRRISAALTAVRATVHSVATGYGLSVSQSGYKVEGDGDPPYGRQSLALLDTERIDSRRVMFSLQLFGAEMVLEADGQAIWRGVDPSGQEFDDAVSEAVLRAYVKGRV